MSTPGKELRIVYLSMCISAFIIMPLLFSFPFSREVVCCVPFLGTQIIQEYKYQHDPCLALLKQVHANCHMPPRTDN